MAKRKKPPSNYVLRLCVDNARLYGVVQCYCRTHPDGTIEPPEGWRLADMIDCDKNRDNGVIKPRHRDKPGQKLFDFSEQDLTEE